MYVGVDFLARELQDGISIEILKMYAMDGDDDVSDRGESCAEVIQAYLQKNQHFGLPLKGNAGVNLQEGKVKLLAKVGEPTPDGGLLEYDCHCYHFSSEG